MKKILLAMVLAAFIAPLAVQATDDNGIGYTYAQLDYVNTSQSFHGAVNSGWALNGSYGFANNWQVFGSYSNLNDRRFQVSDDMGHYAYVHPNQNPWTLGFGYAASIGSRADWVTQASYTHSAYSYRACTNVIGDDFCWRQDESSNIWAVNTGVMGRVTDNLTANAYIGYEHGPAGHGARDGESGNVFGQLGMVYSFTPMWAVEGGVRLNGDSTQTYNVGVRAKF